MSKCVNKRGPGKFGAVPCTRRKMPQKTTTKLKFLSPSKSVLRFWIMLVQPVLILLWKYLLMKEEQLFYWWKVTKFLLTALFANARRDDASKFSGWKYGHFETPTTKTDSLTFLENKRLFARTTYIRLLIYLKAIYGQKMKEIDFSTLATRWSIFPERRS